MIWLSLSQWHIDDEPTIMACKSQWTITLCLKYPCLPKKTPLNTKQQPDPGLQNIASLLQYRLHERGVFNLIQFIVYQ